MQGKKNKIELSYDYQGTKISVVHGDITEETSDVIVNAANRHLEHIDGVAGAIRKKGGYKIIKESNQYIDDHGPLKVGGVCVTGPGDLKCKAVVHAVGPIWHGGDENEPEDLYNAVFESFKLTANKKLKSVSIPAISSGIFGFPKPFCASLMFDAAENFIKEKPEALEEIRFTNFDAPTVGIFLEEAKSRNKK